jgi:hypothetical protein
MLEGYMVFLVPILMIVILVGVFFLYAFNMRRAISRVIEIFYQHHALAIQGAKTLRELGLERGDFVQRMMKPRDYKQYAIQILMKKGILCATEDGKLYLIEDNLDPKMRRPPQNLPSSQGGEG